MWIALAQSKLRPHWLQCPDCKGYFDPHNDPHITIPDGFDEKTICVNCVELSGEIICDECWELIAPGEDVDGCLCGECAEEAGWVKCLCCDKWVEPDEVCYSPSREGYCGECFSEYYDYCGDCGDVFDRMAMVAHNGGLYCTECVSGGENFEPDGFKRRTGRTTETGSERCYGVELETNYCADYSALEDSGAWGAKDDDTISGKEFYSAILDGDDGLAAVADLADLAESFDWNVEDDCGYHLHLDARNESDDALFAAAYAYRSTQELWISFVDPNRANGNYSHRALWTLCDLDGFDSSFNRFVLDKTRDRYEWVNLRAYTTHTTFEVRLHHASIDAREICNWIKAHTRFMDWATTLGLDGVREALDGLSNNEKFDLIVNEVWQDDELRNYYGKKSDLVSCAA